MKFPFVKTVNDEKGTEELAIKFAKEIRNGQVIVLNGNLGSGKTFFIKKLMQYFGINYVSSPSFAIVNEYEGRIKVYHFDFYRLKNINELYDIGWHDYLKDDEAVIFIEWGELINEALPKKRLEIFITIIEGSIRKFECMRYD